MKKELFFRFRVSKYEVSLLNRLSERKGVRRSEFIRQLIWNSARSDAQLAQEIDEISQLIRKGEPF